MKRLLTVLMLLSLTPMRQYDAPIVVTIQLPDTVAILNNASVVVHVVAADTVTYELWSQIPDGRFVQRTSQYVTAVSHLADLDAPLRMCHDESLPLYRFCRFDWLQGQWQLRVAAWRWVRQHKYTVWQQRQFVVQ